ncbi:uncharacterized protein LOC144745907 [Ciona intestinalis]
MFLCRLIYFCCLILYVTSENGETECACRRENKPCLRQGVRLKGIYTPFQECDGYNDCGDWSDENNCADQCERLNRTLCECYKKGNCDRTDKIFYWPCYTSEQKCNRYNNCGDWSDERGCGYQCEDFETPCDCHVNGSKCEIVNVIIEKQSTCYSDSLRCDSYQDCSDWSDEQNCKCEQHQLRCGCILNPDNCTSNSGCISKHSVLDGIQNCADNSDETCNMIQYTFRRLVVPWLLFSVIPNRLYICEDQTSLQRFTQLVEIKNGPEVCRPVLQVLNSTYSHTDWWCTRNDVWQSGVQQCDDKGIFIAPFFCNDNNDCKDGSDEMYDVPGFKCRAKSEYFQLKQSCVLPQVNLYNNNSYCEDGSDNCFVDGKLKCFRCLDGKLMISGKQVCDGVIDCYDLSDECLCQDRTVCDDVFGKSKKICQSSEILCNGVCESIQTVICNKSISCNDTDNMQHCTKVKQSNALMESKRHLFCSVDAVATGYTNATMCDGIPECYNREDMCDVGCSNQTHFCDVRIDCHREMVGPSLVLHLFPPKYCDGRPFLSTIAGCSTGFDEVGCTDRFYCNSTSNNVISVGQNLLCDGVLDCDDGSDEVVELCKDTRYYCLNKQPLSVEISRVEDGFKDCSDGSDECPENTSRATAFSSPYELIGNDGFRGLFWLMGILGILANISVVFVTLVQLKRMKLEGLKTAYLCFVINLSLSDCLMGVYLVAISSKGVEYSGRYCYHDAEWRSSNLCSGFGSLTIISSEVSALTMAVMATFRLKSVYYPFKLSRIHPYTYAIPMILVWLIGIILGTLPMIKTESGYFVSSVLFPNYFYSTEIITKKDFLYLYAETAKFNSSNTPSTNRNDVKDRMAKTFQELEVKAEFGYYGETSVCMPKLFVQIGEAVWEYSTFLIVLNFFLFLYLVAVYAAIFARGQKVKLKEAENRKLQKTISLLILTNFCCWIPICIMAFVSLSGVQLDRIVYVISAGVLLPINSVINPFIIYETSSDHCG